MSDEQGAPPQFLPAPAWHYAYAVICISSALLTVTGTYRAVIDTFFELYLPEFVVSAVAGMLQLVWNDIAYLISKPLKSVATYSLLPTLGSALNFCGAFLLLLRPAIGSFVVRANLILGILASLASIAIILKWGHSDSWRSVGLSAYLVCNAVWLFLIHRHFRQRSRGASKNLR